ncbi:hypothetical protein [Paracoccus sp. (in: a-proteobacteria)]|uniref:hypothetical protein n=1 Tax=Paracoccus sp. TaxID=267 RepID=UPI003A880CAD
MAELHPNSAARLSEDIGDVLTAIRRLIADDEALTAIRATVPAPHADVVDEDAAEFLARRYGGDAALARRLASARPVEREVADATADARDIQRRRASNEVAAAAEPDLEPEPEPQAAADPVPIPSFVARPSAPVAKLTVVPSPVQPVPNAPAPLRLEASRRHPPSAWKFWQRPEPDEAAKAVLPLEQQVTPPLAAPTTADVASEFSALVDDDDEFAEAFDWKARMRPELLEAAAPIVAGQPEPDATLQLTSNEAIAEVVDEPATVAAPAIPALSPEDEEQSIRELLREMIQEELHGELGQRFARNLRAVIRREVAAAIDEQMDRF